jgi:hypothetical protein
LRHDPEGGNVTDEHEQQEQAETESDEGLTDLDISPEEAEKVTGGAISDPCEGGERH